MHIVSQIVSNYSILLHTTVMIAQSVNKQNNFIRTNKTSQFSIISICTCDSFMGCHSLVLPTCLFSVRKAKEGKMREEHV